MKKILRPLVFVFCCCSANTAFTQNAATTGDTPLAAAFHTALAAAERGDAAAQNRVGDMFRKGYGVARNNAQAAVWYCRAAEQGNTDAQFNVGRLYHWKNVRGIRQDKVQATAWIYEAARQGNSLAQRELADFYDKRSDENGVPQNEAQATVWRSKAVEGLRKEAEQGNADALSALAFMYQWGWDVEKDDKQAAEYYRKAIELFRKAADQGDVTAQISLGYVYQLLKDDAHAGVWYRKAAKQGAINAQVGLGEMYAKGRFDIAQDQVQALKWYRMAAEQGDADAQYSLGLMYHNGEGAAKDDAHAVEWLRKAAQQGVTGAIELLREMGVDVRALPQPAAAQPLPCRVKKH